jgi:hypothetical protein
MTQELVIAYDQNGKEYYNENPQSFMSSKILLSKPSDTSI